MALREVANKYLSSCDMTWTGGYGVTTTTCSYFTLHDTVPVAREIERRSYGTMVKNPSGSCLSSSNNLPMNILVDTTRQTDDVLVFQTVSTIWS